jgi:hypothetical protein
LESGAGQGPAPADGGWGDEVQAWADLAHVILNLKEFIFVR